MTALPRAYWLHTIAGGVVVGGGVVEGAEAIAVALAKPGRVQVTAEIAAQLRQGGTWTWSGTALVASAPVVDMARERTVALMAADQTAEAARRPLLSAGFGAAMEYLLTLDEARAWLAATAPAAADFPLLAAELAALAACGQASTLAAVARAVVDADKATRVALAAIKTKRRIAKIKIRLATDVADIDASLTAMKA